MDLSQLPAKVVVVDLWNLVEVCWRPAKNADPERYDPPHVFRLNLQRKLDSLTLALGVSERSFIFAQDSYPAEKHRLWPVYKANRPRGWGGDEYNPAIAAEQRLRRIGCRFIIAPGHEAEDAIAAFVRQVHDLPGRREAVVISSDRDLWALLGRRTRVYDPVRLRWVAADDVPNAFWVRNPANIPLVKAVWGDRSDNVPNALPWLQKRLVPVIEASGGSMEKLLDLLPAELEVLPPGVGPTGREVALEQVRINWKLVRLDDNAPVDWQKDEDV